MRGLFFLSLPRLTMHMKIDLELSITLFVCFYLLLFFLLFPLLWFGFVLLFSLTFMIIFSSPWSMMRFRAFTALIWIFIGILMWLWIASWILSIVFITDSIILIMSVTCFFLIVTVVIINLRSFLINSIFSLLIRVLIRIWIIVLGQVRIFLFIVRRMLIFLHIFVLLSSRPMFLSLPTIFNDLLRLLQFIRFLRGWIGRHISVIIVWIRIIINSLIVIRLTFLSSFWYNILLLLIAISFRRLSLW